MIWWFVLCCGMALVVKTDGQPWEFVGGLLMIVGGISLGASIERITGISRNIDQHTGAPDPTHSGGVKKIHTM